MIQVPQPDVVEFPEEVLLILFYGRTKLGWIITEKSRNESPYSSGAVEDTGVHTKRVDYDNPNVVGTQKGLGGHRILCCRECLELSEECKRNFRTLRYY
jgi:hypothetical protein